MEIYLLLTIPVVFIQTVFGQGVEFPFLTTPHTAKSGEVLTVVCALTANTPSATDAQFKWINKNGAQITNEDANVNPYLRPYSAGGRKGLIMYIRGITDDDAGTYKCSATVNQQQYEKQFVLTVKASLTFRECPIQQFGVLGRESTIRCTADAGGVLVQTTWEKDYNLIERNDRIQFTDTSMKILNTSDSDAGVYSYTAMTLTSDSETKIQVISFEVYIAPIIVNPILQTTAVVGKKASLFCKARGRPDPIIEWRKTGSTNVLQTTDRITVTQKKEGNDIQGILDINSVMKEDKGNYSCYAKNRATDENMATVAQTSNTLIVQTPPTIQNTVDSSGRESGPASLICEARGEPIPKMVWENVRTQERYSSGSSAAGISVTKVDIPEENNPGAKLTLSFSSLKHTDAGQYRCEAINDADTASKVVTLEVKYSPNFDNQETTVFYNWLGNTEAYINCIATANPSPVFTWWKGTREILSGDAFQTIIPSVENEDPDNPHKTTSKLKVSYKGNNDEAVFGEYTCVARNTIGINNISLSMLKAERPKEPQVTVKDFDARHFKFWLMAADVQGPDVTHFKIVYKQKGVEENARELMVEKEYRDFIDQGRRATEVIVENLEPSTMYVFTFYALNPVGEGPPLEITRSTNAISVPDNPVIITQSKSQFPDRIIVQWTIPSDGGATILKYSLTYQRVSVKNVSFDPTKGYELASIMETEQTVDNIKDSPYTLTNLLPGQYYSIKVYAHNSKGVSFAGDKIILTTEAETVPGASSGKPDGLSTGAIIGIVIGIFCLLFIIVDVTCYFKNNCGILMSIREKVAGGREEGYSVAKTEDAENLAKKDELTEEVKAAEEEGELAENLDDEKKEPLLSPEEQKVDTVDETNTQPDSKELEPEEKDTINKEQPQPQSPKTEQAPVEPPKEEKPATDEQPSPDKAQG